MEGTEKLYVYIDGAKVSPDSVCVLLDDEGFVFILTFPDGEEMRFIRGNYYEFSKMFSFSSKDIV